MSAIVYQIFISHQMIEPNEKCFLFHLKSSLGSRDIQILYFCFPIFFSLSAIAEVDQR